MLDLVETVFDRHGIRRLRYDGSMNREARDFVLAQFRKADGPRVICIRSASHHPSAFSFDQT